jgi:hypothetical protein
MEKLMANPVEHSREQLYRWLAKHRFTISDDGNILAYKGVNWDESRQVHVSSHPGPAIVDGVPHTDGHVPNREGSVIEMPRSDVDWDPSSACSTGLHVANWDYANGFASHILLVEVDPGDVVSVPTDAYDQKVRTCRYVVHGLVDGEYKENVLPREVYASPEVDVDEEDYEEEEYNEDGYDVDGYDSAGYDVDGYDSDGYDEDGHTRDEEDWEETPDWDDEEDEDEEEVAPTPTIKLPTPQPPITPRPAKKKRWLRW